MHLSYHSSTSRFGIDEHFYEGQQNVKDAEKQGGKDDKEKLITHWVLLMI